MAKKVSSVLGVDIGSQKIKVCELKTQGREPVVTALGIIDTPEGAVDHTGIYNEEAVGVALKQLLSQSGASTSNVVVTVAGQASVLVRTLEVPKMSTDELKDHMGWEINRNIPFAESTVVSDFKPLGGDDPNGPNMDVVMAIAPQSAIDRLIALLKKAGRSPFAIDVEPLSLARTIASGYSELADKTICLVEMGAKTASINIYHGTKLLMPRQVPIGGELFTQSLADGLGIALDEAEQLKQSSLEIPEGAAQASIANDPFAGGATQQFGAFNPFADDAAAGYAPSNPFATDEPVNPFAQPDDMAPAAGGTPNPFEDVLPSGYPGEEIAPAAEPATADDAFAPQDPYASTDPYAAPDPYASQDPYATSDVTPVVAEDSEAMRNYQLIAPILEEFVAEIRRSIDYFRGRGGEVDQILLAGGAVKIRGLSEYLSAVLGVPCDLYDPLRRLNVSAKKVTSDFIDQHRADFAIAVGNGLHIFSE